MIETIDSLPKDIKPSDRVIYLKPYQYDFIFNQARYPALVSAWGTGKTMCGCEKVRLACEQKPKNLILVVRKEFVDLKDSTIKDWNEYTGVTVNSSRDAIFPNGSIVMFRHAEELKGNNLNNMNLGGFLMEQGEEFESDDPFFKMQGRLRRCFGCGKPMTNGKPKCVCVGHFGAVIANTAGHNWIYKLWKAKKNPDYPLSEATSFDNADILPAKTVEDWKKLKDLKPKIYNRFVMNSWDDADLIDVIIQPEWIENAKKTRIVLSGAIRRIVSIDVARGGADMSAFYAIENYIQRGTQTHNTRNSMELVGRAQLFAQSVFGSPHVAYAVDEIGVGAGVADRLVELGFEVVMVNAAVKEGVPAPYYNRRSEILGNAAVLFQEGKVQLDPLDTELAEQLSWTKWRPLKSNAVLQAESKDEVRETYGRSPDNADAYLNGLWALALVKPFSGYDRVRSNAGWVHPRFRQDGLRTPHYVR